MYYVSAQEQGFLEKQQLETLIEGWLLVSGNPWAGPLPGMEPESFFHTIFCLWIVSQMLMLGPKPMGNVTLSALVMFELSFQGRSDVVDIVSQNEVCYKVTRKTCMETSWVRG